MAVVRAVLSWMLWRASWVKTRRAESWIDECERYGRSFTRSLTRALRKQYEKLEEQKRTQAALEAARSTHDEITT